MSDLRLLTSIQEVKPEEWNALVDGAHQPFNRWEFHAAAELSGCATARRGWQPLHLALYRGTSLIALAPGYIKQDSDGDFSRDFGWAAAERAGIAYYPKLIISVPFTPVTGQRLFLAPGEDPSLLVEMLATARQALVKKGVSSFHVLFPTAAESTLLETQGWAQRVDFQYHWRNQGYATFDDFLARFDSKRRNQIKRERAEPAKQGITIRTLRQAELAEDPTLWAKRAASFHAQTVDQMAWGRRFVDEKFYQRLFTSWLEPIELVVAERDAQPVALAFNVATPTHLFGRYWGCVEEHKFLHFNVCQYHSVEECIARGLRVFEGGAGGEHKLHRGFEPSFTYSNHQFVDMRLSRSVEMHLEEERAQRREALARWQNDKPVLRHPPSTGKMDAPFTSDKPDTD